ncbi:MAG TPA: hypothetical protein VHG32_15710 [Thermoanaerobaculia bacterium]|nr:hypothetical protein [Thermoanaerobaculia bacterium]
MTTSMIAEPQEIDPHEIQRLRYVPGQDLLSRDFRDQAAFAAQLRWWHNRAAHGAFGVSRGLGVSLDPAAREPTARVAGGLAYDAFGRELILPAPAALRVPAGPLEAEPRALVIRYRESGGQNGADLAWIAARRLRPAGGVPLARVVYDGGVPSLDLDFHPPAARPLARPKLGRGSTVQGGTAWEIWDLGEQQRLVLGLQVAIDTRAAGFTQLPCYFAWVQGAVEGSLETGGPRFPLPLYSHLAAESPTAFRCRVLTFVFGRRDNLPAHRNLILSQARQQLSVCWLGIQMRCAGQAPPEVIHVHP